MTREFLESGLITAILYQKPADQWELAIQLLYEFLMEERSAPLLILIQNVLSLPKKCFL